MIAELRDAARESYLGQAVAFTGETVGLACALTGIADPSLAIAELVDAELRRWARLKVWKGTERERLQ